MSKDERTRKHLDRWSGGEGVLYIGKAQEKARVLRTERRHDPTTGDTYLWLAAATAMVNHYYFYAVDDDFGPFFLKFCSYFPYNAKLCINGHEYLKRQLTKRGIGYESLDNGIHRCADPGAMQRLSDSLTAAKVDALLRKWLARLPHPFAAGDRRQGIRYALSILQAEFALTQVFDRPVQGRVFFEQVVRENLDMGRPDHVQLIFARRVTPRPRAHGPLRRPPALPGVCVETGAGGGRLPAVLEPGVAHGGAGPVGRLGRRDAGAESPARGQQQPLSGAAVGHGEELGQRRAGARPRAVGGGLAAPLPPRALARRDAGGPPPPPRGLVPRRQLGRVGRDQRSRAHGPVLPPRR